MCWFLRFWLFLLWELLVILVIKFFRLVRHYLLVVRSNTLHFIPVSWSICTHKAVRRYPPVIGVLLTRLGLLWFRTDYRPWLRLDLHWRMGPTTDWQLRHTTIWRDLLRHNRLHIHVLLLLTSSSGLLTLDYFLLKWVWIFLAEPKAWRITLCPRCSLLRDLWYFSNWLEH